MNWVDELRDFIFEKLVEPLLREYFPSGIPAEALQAIMPEIDNLITGEPVRLLELRRLVASIVTHAFSDTKEALE